MDEGFSFNGSRLATAMAVEPIPQRFDPFRDQILKHLALMPRFGIAVS
jgi:hypothetical protein